MNHIILNHQIFIDKFSAKRIVCVNSSNSRSSKKNIFRFFFFEKFFNGKLISQIKFFGSSSNNICKSFLLKFSQDGRTHHSPMTGNVYFVVLIHADSKQ